MLCTPTSRVELVCIFANDRHVNYIGQNATIIENGKLRSYLIRSTCNFQMEARFTHATKPMNTRKTLEQFGQTYVSLKVNSNVVIQSFELNAIFPITESILKY